MVFPILSDRQIDNKVGSLLKIAEFYGRADVKARTVTNTHDHTYRLATETAAEVGGTTVTSTYGYDKNNNRTSKIVTGGSNPGTWTSVYGTTADGYNSNQLKTVTKGGVLTTFQYDANGNRSTKQVGGAMVQAYVFDFENRLITLADLTKGSFGYTYDHRTRRVGRDELGGTGVPAASVKISFSGGLSVQEYTAGTGTPNVETIRGSDYGGGIGGVLYTIRNGARSYNAYNSRGDVVSKTDGGGSITWQSSYEAFGTRTQEQGTTADRQKANTKDEDPTGLLNEGFRYRDLEFGVFITRDPMGFVDGPNVYTYVTQNPWTKFDPRGLAEKRVDAEDKFEWKGDGHHQVPREVVRDAGWDKEAKQIFDDATIDAPNGHNYTAHGKKSGYSAEVGAEMAEFLNDKGGLGCKTAREQVKMAEEFVERISNTNNDFIKGFNGAVSGGPAAVKEWFESTAKGNIGMKSTGKLAGAADSKIVTGIAKTLKYGGKLAKGVPILAGVITAGSSFADGKEVGDVGIDVVMSATGGDIAKDATEWLARPALNAIEKRNAQMREILKQMDE
jgi:RHS repeat-associated protein